MVKEIGLSTLLVFLVISASFFAMWLISKRIYETDTKRKEHMDHRSSLLDETVTGILNIKLNGWGEIIREKMNKIRKKESEQIRSLMQYLGLQMTSNNMVIPLSCFLCLSLYITWNEEASVSTVFLCLLYLSVLYDPIQCISYALFMYGSIRLSLERVNQVFDMRSMTGSESESQSEHELRRLKRGELMVRNGSFSWNEPKTEIEAYRERLESSLSGIGDQDESKESLGSREGFCVKNVNLSIKQKETCYLVGRVGSGKSSLIYALLKNLYKLRGEIGLNGSVALIPQEPFLLNDTLKNNIIFGKEYDAEKYSHVIRICELESDLRIFPAGDMTEIGERGINLSGGQKQRVSIARAVYADSDIYLVDDCLSALDAHVGKSILENVFKKHLKEKTKLIATHHYHYIEPHERVLMMSGGVIKSDGRFKDLQKTEEFRKIAPEAKESEELENEPEETKKLKSQRKDVMLKEEPLKNEPEEPESKENPNEKEKQPADKPEVSAQNFKGKLIQEEDREYGIISWGVYAYYLSNGGIGLVLFLVLVFLASSGVELLTIWWVTQWADDTLGLKDQDYFLSYSIIVVLSFVMMIVKYSLFALVTKRISFKVFSALFWNLLRRKMAFFDTTSSGTILNRCVDDVGILDFEIPDKMCLVSAILFQLLATIMLTSSIYPYILLLMVPNFVACYLLMKKFLLTSTELKRINKMSISPMLTTFSELVKGGNILELYGYKGQIMKKYEEEHNLYIKVIVHEIASKAWFQLVVDFFFSLNLTIVTFFIASARLFK